ncbi:rhodanese-like domain-containing protein [Anaerofustis butyriciformans]|uniref:rhodanese-like domain-containing protein n=1 Tax=Anaerofustis TaxID=264995 RepID=UPI003F8B9BFA
MKTIIVILLIAILLFISFKFLTTKEEPTSSYNKITVDKAKEMMEKEDVIIIDVRTEDEYNTSHIKNAILIPNETIGNEKLKEVSNLNQKIIIYCRSGARSKKAAMKLINIGYKNVYDMGGIMSWPYETVTE